MILKTCDYRNRDYSKCHNRPITNPALSSLNFDEYFFLVHHVLVDRLGDQKDQVRDASITLLTNIMDVSSSPQVSNIEEKNTEC